MPSTAKNTPTDVENRITENREVGTGTALFGGAADAYKIVGVNRDDPDLGLFRDWITARSMFEEMASRRGVEKEEISTYGLLKRMQFQAPDGAILELRPA